MKNLETAYKEAIKFAGNHYENFPVVSFMVKKELRKHVAMIYTFARRADDTADEGEAEPDERIHALDEYEKNLENALSGDYKSDFWMCLANTIDERNLSIENFTNLISAFQQDISKKRYSTHDEVLNYCERSANPVGRLILELNGIRDAKAIRYSDMICSALQITNFLQDVSVDLKKGRIYIPISDMRNYGIRESEFIRENDSKVFRELIRFEVDRVEEMFDEGSQLLDYLSGRLKVQINWTILGGKRILAKIAENDYNVLLNRPVISKAEYVRLFVKALWA